MQECRWRSVGEHAGRSIQSQLRNTHYQIQMNCHDKVSKRGERRSERCGEGEIESENENESA